MQKNGFFFATPEVQISDLQLTYQNGALGYFDLAGLSSTSDSFRSLKRPFYFCTSVRHVVLADIRCNGR